MIFLMNLRLVSEPNPRPWSSVLLSISSVSGPSKFLVLLMIHFYQPCSPSSGSSKFVWDVLTFKMTLSSLTINCTVLFNLLRCLFWPEAQPQLLPPVPPSQHLLILLELLKQYQHLTIHHQHVLSSGPTQLVPFLLRWWILLLNYLNGVILSWWQISCVARHNLIDNSSSVTVMYNPMSNTLRDEVNTIH